MLYIAIICIVCRFFFTYIKNLLSPKTLFFGGYFFLAITLTFTCNFQYLLIGKLFKLYSVMSVFDLCFAYTSMRAH